jgi:hypothetical protein
MELGKHIQDRVDEVRRTEEVSRRALQVESETADLMVELDKKRDPATVADDFANGFQEIKERALDGVNDMKVANALTSHLGQREVADTVKTKHLSWKWTVENGQEAVKTDVDQIIANRTSRWTSPIRPVQFAKYADEIHARVDAAVGASLITRAGAYYDERKTSRPGAYRTIIDDPRAPGESDE